MAVRPAAILFDCDGTLLLTADLHFHAMTRAVTRQGAAMPRDWYMARTGLGRRDLFTAFVAEIAPGLDVSRLCTDSIAETRVVAGNARPNPAVVALARRVAGQVPTAVATNGEQEIVTSLLRETGLVSLFDTVVSIDDVDAPKPAPDMFLLAADRLRVEATSCLVLEDSDQGLAAAHAAGMAAIDVRRGGVEQELSRLHPLSSQGSRHHAAEC